MTAHCTHLSVHSISHPQPDPTHLTGKTHLSFTSILSLPFSLSPNLSLVSTVIHSAYANFSSLVPSFFSASSPPTHPSIYLSYNKSSGSKKVPRPLLAAFPRSARAVYRSPGFPSLRKELFHVLSLYINFTPTSLSHKFSQLLPSMYFRPLIRKTISPREFFLISPL